MAELGFESRCDGMKSPGCVSDSLGSFTSVGEILLHGVHFLQYKLTVINNVHV